MLLLADDFCGHWRQEVLHYDESIYVILKEIPLRHTSASQRYLVVSAVQGPSSNAVAPKSRDRMRARTETQGKRSAAQAQRCGAKHDLEWIVDGCSRLSASIILSGFTRAYIGSHHNTITQELLHALESMRLLREKVSDEQDISISEEANPL